MRSKYVDTFQHDSQAHSYDHEVTNESDPIRTGYLKTLSWVASKSNELTPKHILELGSGTGNLTVLLENYRSIICVDASSEMTKEAVKKLSDRQNIDFLVADFFEFFEQNTQKYDAIISTYALHHLTDDEKLLFGKNAIDILKPGGSIIIGDLMFAHETARKKIIAAFEAQEAYEIVTDIHEEFFWDISKSQEYLRAKKFSLSKHRFSLLSYGILAKRNQT